MKQHQVWLCDLQADGSWLGRVVIATYTDFAVAVRLADRLNRQAHLISATERHFAS